MSEKYKAPMMDWESPGDLKRRFQLFKQKCELIFNGPLSEKAEEYKSRMLLLWIDDKGLEIYNAADWGQNNPQPGDGAQPNNLQLAHIWTVLEAYVKPRSNQVLASYQLRCLKQEDLMFDEYLTKAKLLLAECHYHHDAVDRILRDTLVFGVKSDKVRRDAIDEGDTLTLQKFIQIAKTHESTETQMAAMKSDTTTTTHAVRSKQKKQARAKPTSNSKPQKSENQKSNLRACNKCDGEHEGQEPCPAKSAVCNYCKKKGHYAKVCFKKKSRYKDVTSSVDSYTLNDIGSITSQEIKEISAISNRLNKHQQDLRECEVERPMPLTHEGRHRIRHLSDY